MAAAQLKRAATAIVKINISGSADQEPRKPSNPSSAILFVIIPRKTKGITKQNVVHNLRIAALRHPPMILLKIIPITKPKAGKRNAAASPKIKL